MEGVMESTKKNPLTVVKKWYSEGLRFKCTGCGKCCTGTPGYVWIGKTELEEMSAHLKISPEEFVKKYTRLVNGHLALLEKKPSYDCIFLKGKLCQIYEVRPKQCRTYMTSKIKKTQHNLPFVNVSL